MNGILKNYAYIIIFIVLAIIAVGFASQGFLEIRKIIAPQEEQLRFDVYQESQARILGDIQHLERLRLSYETADNIRHRNMFRAQIIRHWGVVNKPRIEQINPNLHSWIEELRMEYLQQHQLEPRQIDQ